MIIREQIQCAVEDYRTYLRHITKQSTSNHQKLWIEDTDAQKYKFYGVINDDAFCLTPLISGKNFFTPHFVGDYKGSKPVIVNVRVKNSPYVVIFFVFLFIALINMALELIRNVGSSSFDVQVVGVFGLFLIILVIFSLIMRNKKRKLSHEFSKYILWVATS